MPRTLVYSFTFDVEQTGDITNDQTGVAATTSGGADGRATGGSSGTYSGNLNDSGQMTVIIQREQADRGLVLTIAEHGSNGRNTGAAMCVVYGNTNIICDPNATVTSEEYTLLRFLGSNFINPSEIDENSHWKIQTSDSTVSTVADYHIASNANGVMQITETREVTQHGPGERRTNIQTKIGYDFNKVVPTSIEEYNVDRMYGGAEANSTSTFQTTLKLVSDSMASSMAKP
ncbi:MAG TPA: hypothetical protein VHT92_03380 [Candidatus Cybelea sp.]|nr:hypothetical protein [Candidatus Cybelea sp.]